MNTIVSISDTHGHRINVPDGALLIHAGDATERGQAEELEVLNHWFGRQPHATKIFVPGNHDRLFQQDRKLARSLVSNAICLIDELLEVDGLRIYGSPWVPVYEDWSFMLDEESLREKWEQIPEGLDVLITHGPPHGICDFGWGTNWGSTSLRDRLKAMKAPPRLHFFGHIHTAHGSVKVGETTHYNLAICDTKKQPVKAATVVSYPSSGSGQARRTSPPASS